MIFNSTPKAGSETIWNLLEHLSEPNNFSFYTNDPELKKQRGSENPFLTKFSEREEYINMFQNMSVPFSYVKHLNFLNFEEFNLTNPIYVNMVRHPLERVISWFYYKRQNWYLLDHNTQTNKTNLQKGAMLPTMYKYTYDECVERKMNECVYPLGGNIYRGHQGGSHFSQVIYFKIVAHSRATEYTI